MKFKQKTKPESFTYRKRSGFLFLPKKIGMETRWLEFAKWKEYFIDSSTGQGGWHVDSWID